MWVLHEVLLQSSETPEGIIKHSVYTYSVYTQWEFSCNHHCMLQKNVITLVAASSKTIKLGGWKELKLSYLKKWIE